MIFVRFVSALLLTVAGCAAAAPESKPLFEAVESKSIEKVRAQLAAGANLDGSTAKGLTPLMRALQLNEPEIAALLLEKGASVAPRDQDGWGALAYALYYKQAQIARIILDKGAEINVADHEGWTPLMMALRHGAPEIARLLVEKGAELQAVNKDGWNPLMFALRYGRPEDVDLLVQRGAPVNGVNKGGWTALILAIRYMPSRAGLLIEKGAALDVQDADGFTPLDQAIIAKEPGIARLLVEKGANTDLAAKNKWTALMLAARNGPAETALLLAGQGNNLDAQNPDGWTALMLALKYGQPETARRLVERGARLDLANKDGWTPLLFAISEQQSELATAMIWKGAAIDVVNSDGWTPLMLAAQKGTLALGTLLMDKGARLDAQSKDGWTPLMLALRYGQPELARMLIERGASVSGKNSGGWTPVMLSIKYAPPAASLLLISKGADLHVADAAGECPLLLAAEAGDVQVLAAVMKAVKAKGVKDKAGNTLLHRAAMGGKPAAVEFVLRSGAKIEEVNGAGRTPLLAALEAGQAGAASFLLSKGAKLSAVAENNDALYYAAKSGKKDAVALVVERTGSARTRGNVGQTALHAAGSREVAEYLLAHGAEVDAKTEQDITPLHRAAFDGRRDVAEALIEKGAKIDALSQPVGSLPAMTPLYMAIMNKQAATARLLMEKGADWRSPVKGGTPLFLLAVGKDVREIVELMLAQGQDVRYQNEKGEGAIDYAMSKSMLDLLIEKGADPEAKDRGGFSALHHAAVNGSTEVVEALLDRKLPVNERSASGDTPLHVAKDLKVAELLLAKGASLVVKNRTGRTPYEQAVRSGLPSVAAAIYKKQRQQDLTASAGGKASVARLVDGNVAQVESVVLSEAVGQYSGALAITKSRNIPNAQAMAVSLMRTAANLGNPEAALYLGTATAGVLDRESMDWFRKAAEEGLADGEFEYGSRLMAQASDPKSYTPEAIRMGRYASMRDYYDDAYMWLSAAAAQGHESAARILDMFTGQFSKAGTIDGERQAARHNGESTGFRYTAADAPSVDVKPPVIAFYETGKGNPENDRHYGMRFSKEKARYIMWEITLTHAKPAQKIDLPLYAVWYGPGGDVFWKHNKSVTLEAGREWTRTDYGCGYDDAGKWKPGAYTVDFFVGTLRVARAFFAIH
jgi:ankyrin repeat protein